MNPHETIADSLCGSGPRSSLRAATGDVSKRSLRYCPSGRERPRKPDDASRVRVESIRDVGTNPRRAALCGEDDVEQKLEVSSMLRESFAPPGRQEGERILSTGSATLRAASLHPWLQPAAPPGPGKVRQYVPLVCRIVATHAKHDDGLAFGLKNRSFTHRDGPRVVHTSTLTAGQAHEPKRKN